MRSMFVVYLAILVLLPHTGYGNEEKDDVIQVRRQDLDEVLIERDPFNPSADLLKKTLSEKYVSFSGKLAGQFNLPKIEVTGIMMVGDKIMATANIETLGAVTIKPDDKVVVSAAGRNAKQFDSFIVKEVTPDELVIILDGGYEVRGKFR